MGSIILTGISHGKHQFSLEYPVIDGVMICMAHCQCGYEVEINNFRIYGGTKDLQMKWEKHIGTWKSWVNSQKLFKAKNLRRVLKELSYRLISKQMHAININC